MYEKPSNDEVDNMAVGQDVKSHRLGQTVERHTQDRRITSCERYEYQRAWLKPRKQHKDYLEMERLTELGRLSWRRSLTAETADRARWDRAEGLRRKEEFDAPPQLRHRGIVNDAQSVAWRDADSTASTIWERRSTESLQNSKCKTVGDDDDLSEDSRSSTQIL